MRRIVLAVLLFAMPAVAADFGVVQVPRFTSPAELEMRELQNQRMRLENQRLQLELEDRRQQRQVQPLPYCRYPNGQVALCPR